MEGKTWNLAEILDLPERDEAMIREAQRRFEVGEVIEQCGSWAVTDYGLECLTEHYPIAKDRLYEDEPGHGWMFHMADKTWVNMADFGEALLAARAFHGSRLKGWSPKASKSARALQIGPKLRFKILKRDGYRCCICGSSAEMGARLHVDHKHPVAKGGKNDDANLWTLCAECNQGKGDRDL